MTAAPLTRVPARAITAVGLSVVGIAVMLLGNLPMLSSDLGPVDDHETITWIGRDGGITLTRVPEILRSTEVGAFGATERFRPVGLALKILESWVFGDAAPAWFLVRSVLLGLAAAGFALGSLALLDRALRTLPNAREQRFRAAARILVPLLVLILLQGQEVWEGIANRLGPSENYAMIVLGLAVGILGLVDRPREPSWRRAGVLALGIGITFTLLVLTKETLVSLAPLVGVAVLSLRRTARRTAVLMASVIAAAGPVIVLLAVGPTTDGGDVYGRGFGLGRLYATGLVWVRSPWLAVVLLAALASAVLLDRRGIRAGIGLRWWVLASGVAQIIDMYGHAGEAWLRYRLVLDLGASFQMAVVIVAAVVLLIADAEHRRPDPLTRRWAALVGVGIIVLASLWGGFAIADRHGRAVNRAALAEEFNLAVAAASENVGAEGLVVIVLENVGQGEWAAAAAAFLQYRYGGVASVVALREEDGSVTVGVPTVGPLSAPAVASGAEAAIAAGVPTTCLYFLRTIQDPVSLCSGLPEVIHR